MANWYGWFIEQSFDNQSIFREYKTKKMKSEEENWKEHIVEIPEEKLDDVVRWLKEHLKEAWYSHLVYEDEIVVVYRGKDFRLNVGESFGEVTHYGRRLGIPEEQLPSSKLFKLARDFGY